MDDNIFDGRDGVEGIYALRLLLVHRPPVKLKKVELMNQGLKWRTNAILRHKEIRAKTQ